MLCVMCSTGWKSGNTFYFTNVILLYNTCGFMFLVIKTHQIFLPIRYFFSKHLKVVHNKIVDVLKVYTLVIYLHRFISWSQQYLSRASYINLVVCTCLVWKWCPSMTEHITSTTDKRKLRRNKAKQSSKSIAPLLAVTQFFLFVLFISFLGWETLCCFQQS